MIVTLKDGLLDPQGKAIEDALPAMGWTNVNDVRVGKHIELEIEAQRKMDNKTAEEVARLKAQEKADRAAIEKANASGNSGGEKSIGGNKPDRKDRRRGRAIELLVGHRSHQCLEWTPPLFGHQCTGSNFANQLSQDLVRSAQVLDCFVTHATKSPQGFHCFSPMNQPVTSHFLKGYLELLDLGNFLPGQIRFGS